MVRLIDDREAPQMLFGCQGSPRRLLASVPAFSVIGSEDRFMLALGEEPVTLVADPTRQQPPGVTGTGAVPDGLEQLLATAGTIGAVYGAQQAGPFPPLPAGLREGLAKACEE